MTARKKDKFSTAISTYDVHYVKYGKRGVIRYAGSQYCIDSFAIQNGLEVKRMELASAPA